MLFARYALGEWQRVRVVRQKPAAELHLLVETGGDPGHAAARRTYEKAGCVLLPIARYFKNL